MYTFFCVISFDCHINNHTSAVQWSFALVCFLGVHTDVSDTFSWTEFLRSAGNVVHVWSPAFIRIFQNLFAFYDIVIGFTAKWCHSCCFCLPLFFYIAATCQKNPYLNACINVLYTCRHCSLTFQFCPWKMCVYCSFQSFLYTFVPIPYSQKSDFRFHAGLCICSILHYDLCFSRAACAVPSSGVTTESSRRRGLSRLRSSRTAYSYCLGSLLDPT